MEYLTRQQILGSKDIKTEPVPTPDWECGCVLVRGLTGKQRDWFENSMSAVSGEGKDVEARLNLDNLHARLAVLVIVDREGNLIFSEADADELGEKSGAMLDLVWRAARRLSGLGDDVAKALEKNFESTPPALSA